MTLLIVSDVRENGKLFVVASRKNASIQNMIPAQQKVNFLYLGLNFMIELIKLSMMRL